MCAVDIITDMRQSITDVETPAVVGIIIMASQVYNQMAEHLISSHGAIITRGIFVTTPETVFVQYQVLTSYSSADQCTAPSIADGQRLIHEVRRTVLTHG